MRQCERKVGAIGGGIPDSREVHLHLNAVNGSAQGRAVAADVVTAVEVSIAAAWIRHVRAGNSRIALRRQQCAEAVGSPRQFRQREACLPGQIADGAAVGIRGPAQYTVSVGQLAIGQAIAKFHALDGMALSVEIDIKPLTGARQHVAASALDEAVVIAPGLPGSGLLPGAFLNVAIAIDLATLQATNNDVGIMPETLMQH